MFQWIARRRSKKSDEPGPAINRALTAATWKALPEAALMELLEKRGKKEEQVAALKKFGNAALEVVSHAPNLPFGSGLVIAGLTTLFTMHVTCEDNINIRMSLALSAYMVLEVFHVLGTSDDEQFFESDEWKKFFQTAGGLVHTVLLREALDGATLISKLYDGDKLWYKRFMCAASRREAMLDAIATLDTSRREFCGAVAARYALSQTARDRLADRLMVQQSGMVTMRALFRQDHKNHTNLFVPPASAPAAEANQLPDPAPQCMGFNDTKRCRCTNDAACTVIAPAVGAAAAAGYYYLCHNHVGWMQQRMGYGVHMEQAQYVDYKSHVMQGTITDRHTMAFLRELWRKEFGTADSAYLQLGTKAALVEAIKSKFSERAATPGTPPAGASAHGTTPAGGPAPDTPAAPLGPS